MGHKPKNKRKERRRLTCIVRVQGPTILVRETFTVRDMDGNPLATYRVGYQPIPKDG